MSVTLVAEQLRRRVPGGIGTYVRGLAQGLREAAPEDLDVSLWSSRRAGAGTDPVAATGLRSVTSPVPGWGLTRAWDLGIAGPPAGADVVHATSLAVPPKGEARMSVMVHDLAWRHHPEAYPARGRRWHEAALGRALRRADLFVTPSAMTAHDLVDAGADSDRVEVVEEGSDHLPRPDHDAAAKLLRVLRINGEYLLSVSTLEPRKNLPRLVAAYRAALAQLPEPWPLVVVGPSGWGGDHAATLFPSGPEPGVVMAGAVPDAVLSALYERARLLAYVPLREGFGLPVLEAMRAGTPVVCSPVPSSGDAARLVDPDDIESIAGGLVEVATDGDIRKKLIEGGLARAAGLTWGSSAARHVELWKALRR